MKRLPRSWILVCGLAWILPPGLLAAPPDPEQPDAALEWSDLRGRTVGLGDHRGRIVVLNFWATWCAPCRKEMPDLARIQREFAVYGVQVLGAAADPVEERDHVLEFARRLDVNFPVLLGATTEQMRRLGLAGILPATVVIDADGEVASRTDGVIDRKKLAATLDRLVVGEAPPHEHAGEDTVASVGHRHRHAHDDEEEGHEHGKPRGSTQASLVPS